MTPGQIAYEEDMRCEPHYHDGKPRLTWGDLSEFVQWTWERNPTPRAPNSRPIIFDDRTI